MLDLSLQTVLLRLVALIVLTGVHGFMLALAARLLGARGPVYDGRLTPNPFVHLDLLACIPFILFQIGWIKPVEVEASEVKGGRLGLVLTVVVGLAATLGVVVLVWLARPWLAGAITDASFSSGLSTAIRILFEMTVWFVVVNLVPVPPLTGGLLLKAAAPKVHALLERHGVVVRLVLIAAIALGAATVLRPLFDVLSAWAAAGRR